jgi:GH15 family glucan-1,4-alpha-glucosidase
VWDTSNTLLGLIHAGELELARRGLAYVLEHMVSLEGNAMIAGGFDNPDREQFDQMGELLHALKAYRDRTGDDSLVRQHRAKLLALVERPLRPEFRDATGMVRNRREFWERTLQDGYELAYQNYVILGLRDAAELGEPLGAAERAERWLNEASRIQKALLELPQTALVENGHFIKRRAVNGEPVRTIHFPAGTADVPLKTERTNLADPDATMGLPIAFGLVPPRSALAQKTLAELEKLWDGRWFGGGYERYHSSGQCDQPGPWSFASCFILRAQHEAGLFERSRRTLEWLNSVPGGRTGAWFEEIPLVRSQAPTAGIIPWTSGEVSLFIVPLIGCSIRRPPDDS